MANHANVYTARKMTPEKITELIEGLNHRIFKDLLIVRYEKGDVNEGSLGNHMWFITVKGGEHEYKGQTNHRFGQRVCWLNRSRHFEMRHGGGGNFIWWVDSAIMNEIALRFKGRWIDDSGCDDEYGTEGKYDVFKDYLLRANLNKTDFIKSKFIQEEIPQAFRWENL